ncbi:hypothetical protein EMCRGX_G026682 [Ephydatia muelleri]
MQAAHSAMTTLERMHHEMSDETTLLDLLRRMLLKFERDESPGMSAVAEFDPASPDVYFLVVKWYWTVEYLSQQLTDMYIASRNIPDASSCASRKWAVARAFRYWQQNFPEDFTLVPELQAKLLALQQVMKDGNDVDLLEYMNQDTLPEETWNLGGSVLPNGQLRRPSGSLSFDCCSAEDIAVMLCAIDYKLFRRVPFCEFCIYAHTARPTKDTLRIDECIQFFNGVTNWVVCNILREMTMAKRAEIIVKFVEATRYLFNLHSYNTMLAVLGGLNHFSVRRLLQTWNVVDKSKKEDLNTWTNFFSSHMNYSAYRHAVTQLDGAFCIPVIGIALKDMVAVDTQARDFTNTGSTAINMVKYRKLSTILSGTRRQQLTAPAIQPEMDHLRIIRAAISQSQMDDDALEELSFTREPKQKDAVNNGVKPESDLPKFSEWVSGQATQLDTQTITSHVKLMVDAVFKVYDKDQSGSLSLKEFQSVSSNFPFIQCFSVLDQDNDGQISYDEMLTYFLSANSSLRERFKHNFVEHTFIGTPACDHCKGMMKGIVKQGVRCKDCSVTCHKYCKDYIVVDCSKRKKTVKKRPESMPLDAGSDVYYEDSTASLKERLERAEAARDALSAENAQLHARLSEANSRIQQLSAHVAMMRQHTIGFILEQMNTLSPDMGTEV